MMAVKSSGFIVSLIILISLVGLFGVVMPWLGLKSASEPVTSPPTNALAYQEVSFTSDGLTPQWLVARGREPASNTPVCPWCRVESRIALL